MAQAFHFHFSKMIGFGKPNLDDAFSRIGSQETCQPVCSGHLTVSVIDPPSPCDIRSSAATVVEL
jgi:hypothetical protein